MEGSFKPLRKRMQGDQHYCARPADVFPLLCPVREKEWLEVWDYRMIWSDSGLAEDNCIFSTDFPDHGPELWVVTRFEPPRAIEFVRLARGEQVIRLNVHLTDNRDGTTTARWTYIHTGLDPAGNAAVENLAEAAYESRMRMLETVLNHFLKTGRMLKGVAGDYRQGDSRHVHHRPDGAPR